MVPNVGSPNILSPTGNMGCKKCARNCRQTDGVGMLTKAAALKEGAKRERASSKKK